METKTFISPARTHTPIYITLLWCMATIIIMAQTWRHKRNIFIYITSISVEKCKFPIISRQNGDKRRLFHRRSFWGGERLNFPHSCFKRILLAHFTPRCVPSLMVVRTATTTGPYYCKGPFKRQEDLSTLCPLPSASAPVTSLAEEMEGEEDGRGEEEGGGIAKFTQINRRDEVVP